MATAAPGTRPAQARVNGAWSPLGGKAPPEASRTHITANFAVGQTTPQSPKNGDLWLDTSKTPPQKFYFWGEVKDTNGLITAAGSWHSDSGVRSFIQELDPTTPTGGKAQPTSGDLWINPVTHLSQTWQIPITGAAGWIGTSAAAPVGLSPIIVGSVTSVSPAYHVETFNAGGRNCYYIIHFTPKLVRRPHVIHCAGDDPGSMRSHIRDTNENQFLVFAQNVSNGELWPNDITFVVYV